MFRLSCPCEEAVGESFPVHPMFIVNIKGGLGNQLFQYNLALWLRDRYPGADIRLDTSYFRRDSIHGGYLIENPEFRTTAGRALRHPRIIGDAGFMEDDIPPDGDIVFDGYWQSMRFFGKRLLDFGRLFGSPSDGANLRYAALIKESPSPVFVHVRCGDYNDHFVHGNIATRAYFNNAIRKMTERVDSPEFFVFSDGKGWAEANLDFRGRPTHFVVGNESPARNKWDIYLMGLCRHGIMSNSSFSWWGQHIYRGGGGRLIITPPYWVNERTQAFPSVVPDIQRLPCMTSVPNVPVIPGTEGKSPLFSVIVAAYNQEDCIRRSVSSVLNQTFGDLELVVVDDGSADGTWDVLSEFSAQDSRMRLIRHDTNRSLFMARKTGVREAKGRYILFLDGDDYLFADALQRLHDEVIQKEDFDACEFSYVQRPQNIVIRPRPYAYEISRQEYFMRPDAVVTVWNKLYKTKLVKSVCEGMSDAYINLSEDTCLSVSLAVLTKRFIQRDIPVTNYMLGDGVSTRPHTLADNRRNLGSVRDSLCVMGRFLEKHADPGMADALLRASERRLLRWILGRIRGWTAEGDIPGAYLLLPEFFVKDKIPLPDRGIIKIMGSSGLLRKATLLMLSVYSKLLRLLDGRGIRPLLRTVREAILWHMRGRRAA